jgi:hypothetical protein
MEIPEEKQQAPKSALKMSKYLLLLVILGAYVLLH